MLKGKSKRKQRRNQNPLNTERLEQRAMFSVSPVEPVVALDVGPVNQAGYDCQGEGHFQLTHRIGSTAGPGGSTFMTGEDGRMIVHPQYNVGNDGPMVATVMTGVLNLNPHDSPGPLISDVLQGWDWDEDIIASMDVGAPFETLLDREFEVPEILDLPSRDVLGSELNHDLQNMHPIDTALMDQSITEAMTQDIYMDMVLGSMYYNDQGVSGADVGVEVAQTATEEVAAWSLGGWLGSLFGTTTTVAQGAETGAKGVSNVCKYFDRYEKVSNIADGAEDDITSCEELAGNEEEEPEEETPDQAAENEDSRDPEDTGGTPPEEEDEDDCFPPIILEEIYGDLGKEEIQFNHLGHDNLTSFVDVREMIPTQNHITQSFVSTYNYANSYTRNQAFQNWH